MRRRQFGQEGARSGEGSFLIWDANERISLAEAIFSQVGHVSPYSDFESNKD